MTNEAFEAKPVMNPAERNAMFGLPTDATVEDRIQAAIDRSGQAITDGIRALVDTEGFTLARLQEVYQGYLDSPPLLRVNGGRRTADQLKTSFWDESQRPSQNGRIISEFILDLTAPNDPVVTRRLNGAYRL